MGRVETFLYGYINDPQVGRVDENDADAADYPRTFAVALKDRPQTCKTAALDKGPQTCKAVRSSLGQR